MKLISATSILLLLISSSGFARATLHDGLSGNSYYGGNNPGGYCLVDSDCYTKIRTILPPTLHWARQVFMLCNLLYATLRRD
mmetsp:Transcript_6639/g.10136  ORF Transcript_6639/g.10136 Transcript_6639/m.10136 type:complete len:82 (-) Transcript_6639:394-639(-)